MAEPARIGALLAFITDFAKRKPGDMLAALVLTSLTALFNGMGLLLLLPLLASTGLLDHGSQKDLPWMVGILGRFDPSFRFVLVLVIYVTTISLLAGLKFLAARSTARLSMDYIDHARTTLYRTTLHTPWRIISRHHSHEITEQISSNLDWMMRGTLGICHLAGSLLVVSIQILVAGVISLKLAALAAAIVIPGYPLMHWLQRRALQSGTAAIAHNKRMHETSANLVGRLKHIKAHGDELREMETLRSTSRSLADIAIDLQVSAAGLQLILEVFAVTLIAGLFYIGFAVLQLPLSSLLVFMLVTAQILPKLVGMQRMLQVIMQSIPAHESYQRFIASLRMEREPPPAPNRPSGILITSTTSSPTGPRRQSDFAPYRSVSTRAS